MSVVIRAWLVRRVLPNVLQIETVTTLMLAIVPGRKVSSEAAVNFIAIQIPILLNIM